MKTRKSIRAVFAMLLAAVLLCGSLPVATAYESDGDGALSLKDSTLLSRFLAGGWNVTLQ